MKETTRFNDIVHQSAHEAWRLNHGYIGTEHILLTFIKNGGGLGLNILKNLHINPFKVLTETEKLVKTGFDRICDPRLKPLPYTPRSLKIIEYAKQQCEASNHGFVGTEHLLLGMLLEQEGVAAQVLTNLGVRLESVQREITTLLSASYGYDASAESIEDGIESQDFDLDEFDSFLVRSPMPDNPKRMLVRITKRK